MKLRRIFRSAVPKLQSKNALERLQVFDKIMLLLICQVEIESSIIAIHYIEQRLEPAIVIKTPLVTREHKKPSLPDKNTCKVHGAIPVYGFALRIDTCRGTTRLETVNLHLTWRVLVPPGLSP